LEQSDIELQKTLRALEEKRQIIKRLQDENDSLQAKINNMLNNEGNKKSEDEYYQQQIARLNDQIKALSAN
jgi:flagellar biosynthesis chaperone FliJ